MTERLIDPTFLFRFTLPCRYVKETWTAEGITLNESYALPVLQTLDGAPPLADVRAGWNENGLYFTAQVEGKRQHPWCRDGAIDESDGLHIWIDTRDTQNIHRASRFCHRLAFIPSGGGSRRQDPVAGQLVIQRAREQCKPIPPRKLGVRSENRVGGYYLQVFIPGEVLTGFDPVEYPRLGFMYAIVDRERGTQTLSVSTELPYDDDPSLWVSLELVKR
jgi:hypothetical protein